MRSDTHAPFDQHPKWLPNCKRVSVRRLDRTFFLIYGDFASSRSNDGDDFASSRGHGFYWACRSQSIPLRLWGEILGGMVLELDVTRERGDGYSDGKSSRIGAYLTATALAAASPMLTAV